MAERSTVVSTGQLGMETTPGTAVVATKKLTSFGWEITPSITFKKVRPKGYAVNTAVVPGREFTAMRYSAENAYFTDAIYPANGLIKNVTPTQIIPTTGLAYGWTFPLSSNVEDVIKTYTLEYGSASRGERVPYTVFDTIHFAWDRDGVTMDGEAFGQQMLDPFTLTTAGITELANVPVTGNLIDVSVDPTSAALGTTKLLRAFAGDCMIGPRFNRIFPLDSTLTSFAAHVHKDVPLELKLIVEADAVGMGYLANARAGDKRFIRVNMQGPLIETGAPNNYYLLRIDLCGEISAIGAIGDRDSVQAIEYTFSGVHDATYGKATQLYIVNTLSAL